MIRLRHVLGSILSIGLGQLCMGQAASQDASFVNGADKEDEPQQSAKPQLKQFRHKIKVSDVDPSRSCQRGLGRAKDDRVDRHEVGISRLRTNLSKVETAPAFVYGWTLPGDVPFTGRTH